MVSKKGSKYVGVKLPTKSVSSISETHEADFAHFDNVEPKEFFLFI